MFMTYATLTSSVKSRTRAQQLMDWLGGPSFDGVLCFDEAHRMKNFSAKEGQVGPLFDRHYYARHVVAQPALACHVLHGVCWLAGTL